MLFSTKYACLVMYDDIGDNMKKYLVPISIAVLIGFFLGKIFLEQYSAYNGIKIVSNKGEILYFIKYGVYDSLEELEKETLSFTNYIYNEIDGSFHAYIGITRDEENLSKLTKYYDSKGYKTTTEEFLVTSQKFLEILVNYDNILKNTEDEMVITSVNNLVLEKYEELVINGSQD